MRTDRALLSLALAGLFTTPALAQTSSADVAQLLQSMQERLARLEARNAELEKRLAEAPAPAKEAALSARVEDVENELLALRKKPDPLAKFEGFSAGASLTVVAQQASGTGTASGASQLTARADITAEMPLGAIGDAEGKLFAHFRAGDGAALALGGFASANATAFGNNPQPVLMQAWYQVDVPVGGAGGNLGRVEFTLGKIDPFGFFDGNGVSDDETEGFLNLAFVHNPILDAGGDIGVGTHGASPGMRLAYVSDINGGDHVTVSAGVFGTGTGANYAGPFHKPLSIAQVEYAGKALGHEGAWRVYTWNNAQARDLASVEQKHAGWGLSFDQGVMAGLTLFGRYGRSTKGQINFDRALTFGGQLHGTAWGRAEDRLGLAHGWMKSSNDFKAANPGFGTEKVTELFYVWQANENFHLTPSVQWIQDRGGNPAQNTATVLGLRAKASF